MLPGRPRIAGFALLLAMIIPALAPASEADIERQRALFRQAYEPAERGDWRPVEGLDASDRELLERYVLWPDLRAAWLRTNLKRVPAADVEEFLQRFGTLRPARDLRYRFALQLARSGDLDRYFALYEQFYQGLEIPALDCYALRAEIQAGREKRVKVRALELWMVGHSQAEECDPIFTHLEDNGLLGPTEYQRRFELAIESREFTLARWVARKIDQQHLDEAIDCIAAQANPEDFLKRHARARDHETLRAQLVYATERLTFRDPVLARKLWGKVGKRFAFTETQRQETARHIALWTARDRLPGAYDLLVDLPEAAWDDEVLRWRARTSIRTGKWVHLVNDVKVMSEEERDSEEWRYWQAVALQRIGQLAVAHAEFEALSKERSYYGFLAADEIGRPYALQQELTPADDQALAALESDPGLVRARELFLVGLESRGRSEWDAAIERLSEVQKRQASLLADRWGWHSRAIATAASAREYDDLEIRYPLPYLTQFESAASAANISPTWAYGIARSESLFMPDVRSSAGAVGLMQLMPATGRQVAKDIRLPYAGLATLTDPTSNIRLGTTYLGQMAARYSGNAVAATAAYNAGPHRVDEWLPASGSVDARVWIESIPFNETRNYVKRVLAAQTIFHWRMTGEVRRISDQLPSVKAPSAAHRLAAR